MNELRIKLHGMIEKLTEPQLEMLWQFMNQISKGEKCLFAANYTD